jgi:prepilin-type N-terminal cleavage/methylation domain-containing protein
MCSSIMYSLFVGKREQREGFTLLELLIVIAIIAILSVMLIIVINPIETLRKSRDSQRISDLNTLKTAMGIYTTSYASPSLDGLASSTANTTCRGASAWTAGNKMWFSLPSDTATISNVSLTSVILANQPTIVQVTKANLARVDGTGWLPVNFDALPSGSPISGLPVDPVNTVSTASAPANTDLIYRYACGQSNLSYEINARLESNEYTVINNRMQADGGDNDNLYEVGTSIRLIGTGSF